MGKLTSIHLFGYWYTVTYAFWLGGFLAFSAPGVFEATHTRFGAFFVAFFHGPKVNQALSSRSMKDERVLRKNNANRLSYSASSMLDLPRVT